MFTPVRRRSPRPAGTSRPAPRTSRGLLGAFALLITGTLLGGCSVVAAQTTAGFAPVVEGTQPDVRVATSLYPLEFLAREIGGEDVEVVNLTPAGAEPHDLELTPIDIFTLHHADLVLTLSGFQPAVDAALAAPSEAEVSGPEALDVTAAARLRPAESEDPGHETDHDREHGHELSGMDPHFWLDPIRLADVAGAVATELAAVDPQHAEQYRTRAAALQGHLEGLDADYSSGLADCARRTIITSHQAFTYLADRYDLAEVSVAGLDPESEPAPVRLHEIAQIIDRTGATTVFTEPLTPSKVATVLGSDLSIAVAVLDPLESPTATVSDPGRDLLDATEANLATLRSSLDCR